MMVATEGPRYAQFCPLAVSPANSSTCCCPPDAPRARVGRDAGVWPGWHQSSCPLENLIKH
eukprot:4813657-Lingulodinium_polyedra.AAC.1